MTTLVKDKALMMEEVRKLVSEGRTVTLTVKGNSMNPFVVSLRDQMILGPWKDEDIRKGCVVLVRDTRGNYLIHRIVERNGNNIRLIGDGNVGLYETAQLNEVIAIMYSIIRKGKEWKADDRIWKLYSWFWMLILPVRRWPLGLWRRIFLKTR